MRVIQIELTDSMLLQLEKHYQAHIDDKRRLSDLEQVVLAQLHSPSPEGAPSPNQNLRSLPRVETGVVQFEDDWPGVFIRGDNATFIANLLAFYTPKLASIAEEDVINVLALAEHGNLLGSCLAIGPNSPVDRQVVIRQAFITESPACM
jgi:hypothetical protein